jgi:hypothetical protein
MDDEAAVDVVRSPLARPPHSLENIDAVRRLAWAQQSYLEDTDFDSQQFTSNPQPVFTKRAVIGAAALGAAGLATAGIIYRKELHNFFRQGKKSQEASEDAAAALISKLGLATRLDNIEEVKIQLVECIKHTRQLQKLNSEMRTRIATIEKQ